MKRTIGILSTVGMIGAAVALATPAHATVTGTITANTNGTATITYTATAGEVVSLFICPAGTPSCNPASAPYTMASTSGSPAPLPSPTNLTVGTTVSILPTGTGPLPAGDYVLTLFSGSDIDANVPVTISDSGGSDSGGSAGDDSSAPADIVQQIGMPSAGCSSIDLPLLNWAGVAGGGWGASWAEWANEGRGGAVCTRTLSYSTSSAAWYIR